MGLIDGLIKVVTAPITVGAAIAEDAVVAVTEGKSENKTDEKLQEIVDSFSE